jgi:hypothetical protein
VPDRSLVIVALPMLGREVAEATPAPPAMVARAAIPAVRARDFFTGGSFDECRLLW